MAGRKKLTPAEPGTAIQIADKTPAAIAATEVLARDAGEFATTDEVLAWMDTTLQVGHIRAATVSATVNERIIAESYARLLETKSYLGAPYQDSTGERKRVSTIDEFCSVFLGRSARRCRQLVSNLETLGEELYDSAQKLGLGQRDYNALKVLPADDQDVIKQAIAAGGDRESVIGLLASLAERQAVEKAELQADIDAKDKRAEAREREIERKTAQIAKLKKHYAKAEPDEVLRELEHHMVGEVLSLTGAIQADSDGITSLYTRARDLVDHAEQHGLDLGPWLSGQFAQVERTLHMVRESLGIERVAVGDPEAEARLSLGEPLDG